MRKITLLTILAFIISAPLADARIKTTGRGDKMNFDPESIPPNFQASFELMSRKCIKCHTMERTVIAVVTGRAPITGQLFDKQAVKAYGIKMLRKPNSDMSKSEVRDVVLLLNYMLDNK